jgi:hypothetical protein
MQDIVLYCKSYHRDVLRVARLLDSIERHNADRLPVYISMPASDRALFESKLGRSRCTLIDDEQIVYANPRVRPADTEGIEGRVSQAMVRSEFWRLGVCRAYLCIDSDSKFIADFRRHDLVAPDGHPYTVLHQNKDLLQLAADRGVTKVGAEFRAELARIRQFFPREGPGYSFVPSPFLWSAHVWESLDREYLQPRGQTLWNVITREVPEYLWYGEALLAYQAIPLRPVEPLFRVYHYNWQYYALKRMGETEAKVAENYIGVIYQSNWEYELDYGLPPKSLGSRAVRGVKRSLRYLQNRWLV